MKRYAGIFICCAVLVPLEALSLPQWPVGSVFMIKDKHYKAASEVKASVFEGRVIKWLKGEFPERIESKNNAELLTIIKKSIEDCTRMGTLRERDILEIVLVRLMTPGLMEDEKAWQAIMNDPWVNELQRPGVFFDTSALGRKVFFAQQRNETPTEELAKIDYEYPGEPGMSNQDTWKRTRLKIGLFLKGEY